MFGLGPFSRKIGPKVSVCQWFSSRSPLRFSNGTRHSSISRRNFLQSSHRKIWYFVSGEKSYWSKRYTDPSYFSIAKPSNLYRTFNKINMTEFHLQTKPKDFFSKSAWFTDFDFFSKMDKKYFILDCKLKKIGCKMQWKPRWTRIDFRVFENLQTGCQTDTFNSLCDWLGLMNSIVDRLRAPSRKHQFENPTESVNLWKEKVFAWNLMWKRSLTEKLLDDWVWTRSFLS